MDRYLVRLEPPPAAQVAEMPEPKHARRPERSGGLVVALHGRECGARLPECSRAHALRAAAGSLGEARSYQLQAGGALQGRPVQ